MTQNSNLITATVPSTSSQEFFYILTFIQIGVDGSGGIHFTNIFAGLQILQSNFVNCRESALNKQKPLQDRKINF